MPHFLFLAGPPAGKRLWDAVLDRLHARGAEASAIDVGDLAQGCQDTPDWIAQLTQAIQQAGPCVLIAHGTAVPLACHAAARAQPAGLVLSNGPTQALSPAMRAMCKSLRLLNGAASMKLLASPAGLRRSVVNPYVWDHDTVVTVCGPLFEAGSAIAQTKHFLSCLPKWADKPPQTNAPTVQIYGTSDLHLSPLNGNYGESNDSVIAIDGGQHYHPLDRPWEIADRTLDWARSTLTTT